jgi:hypothetical protein
MTLLKLLLLLLLRFDHGPTTRPLTSNLPAVKNWPSPD